VDLSDDLRIGAGSEVGSGPGTGGIYLKWLSRISRTTKKPPADTQHGTTSTRHTNLSFLSGISSINGSSTGSISHRYMLKLQRETTRVLKPSPEVKISRSRE
jgi:hypothetical protein